MKDFLLSDWAGFSEIDLPDKKLFYVSHNNCHENHLSAMAATASLSTNTKRQLAIRKYVISILLSMQAFYGGIKVEQHCEGIKFRAQEIADSFLSFPRNKAQSHVCDIQELIDSEDANHISHLLIFNNMTNIHTSERFDLGDTHILALMLIHESIRYKGDKSFIAGLEAIEVIGLAELRFARYSDKYQQEKKRLQSSIKAADARHEASRKVKEFAQKKAIRIKRAKSRISMRAIARNIEEEAIQKAKEVSFHIKKEYFCEVTLYSWIREALKEDSKKF